MPISWHPIYCIAVRGPNLCRLTSTNVTLVGYCLRHPVEQQGSLEFMSRVEKVLGWRTSWMRKELEKRWTELAAFDSWDS
jgi:hypothetical protein